MGEASIVIARRAVPSMDQGRKNLQWESLTYQVVLCTASFWFTAVRSNELGGAKVDEQRTRTFAQRLKIFRPCPWRS